MRGLLYAATNKIKRSYRRVNCYAERCREAQFLFNGVVSEIEEALKELEGVHAAETVRERRCQPMVLEKSRKTAMRPFEAQFSLKVGITIIAIVRIEMPGSSEGEEGLRPRVRFTIYPSGSQFPMVVHTTPQDFVEDFSEYIAAFL